MKSGKKKKKKTIQDKYEFKKNQTYFFHNL